MSMWGFVNPSEGPYPVVQYYSLDLHVCLLFLIGSPKLLKLAHVQSSCSCLRRGGLNGCQCLYRSASVAVGEEVSGP